MLALTITFLWIWANVLYIHYDISQFGFIFIYTTWDSLDFSNLYFSVLLVPNNSQPLFVQKLYLPYSFTFPSGSKQMYFWTFSLYHPCLISVLKKKKKNLIILFPKLLPFHIHLCVYMCVFQSFSV